MLSLAVTIAPRYYSAMAIQSFRCRQTEALYRGASHGPFPQIARVALRKLVMLNAATTLNDLRVPPNNQLEALKDDRAGQHSIRVNRQYRVCFVWTDAGPTEVEIVDYH
jgi:proteic killer suppression protein